jgi:hypothetical protein
LGRDGASLARWLVERRRRLALRGLGALAFGSDTAASVRLPAAMTGNAGLKFTKDRWSSEGIVPLSFTFDTPGRLRRARHQTNGRDMGKRCYSPRRNSFSVARTWSGSRDWCKQ